MLVKPSRGDLKSYLSTAYQLSLDMCRSGYPTYTDGIQTRADFENAIWRGYEQNNREQFLFCENGRIRGLIQYFVIPEDHYLQTEICSIAEHTAAALSELETHCAARYPGYDLYWGFPEENEAAAAYLRENGWVCAERSSHAVAHITDNQHLEEAFAPTRVTKDNYADFRVLHDRVEESMYWNSHRLLKSLDNWMIWISYEAQTPIGAVYYTANGDSGEIFGIDLADGICQKTVCCDLLRRVLNDCREKGIKHITYFHDADQRQAVEDMGFSHVGEYLLFIKRIHSCE